MKARTVALAMLAVALFAGVALSQTAPLSDARELVKLSLEECIKLALEQNPEVALNEAKIDQAKAQTVQAKANQYPQLNFSANAVRTNMLSSFASGGIILLPTTPNTGGVPLHTHSVAFSNFEITTDREGDILGAKIEAQYALYTAGQVKNGIKVAQLNEDVAKEDLRAKKNDLVYSVKSTFLGVLLAQMMLLTVDDGIKTASAHVDQVNALFNEGIVSDLDVLRARAAVDGLKPTRIQVENNLNLAKLGLNNFTGLDLDAPIEVIGDLEYHKKALLLPEDLYAQAMANRPEMKTMAIRKEMLDKLLAIAKAGGMPKVGAFANYGLNQGQNMPPNDKEWQGGYQAGVAVTMPLYDGGKTAGQVAEVVAQARQLEAGRRALELGIKTQIHQALLAIQAAEEKIQAIKSNFDSARKSNEAAAVRYESGLASNLEVLDAQTKLIQVSADALQATYEYNLAWAQLEHVIGDPIRR